MGPNADSDQFFYPINHPHKESNQKIGMSGACMRVYARAHAMRPRTCSSEQQSVQSPIRKVLYKECSAPSGTSLPPPPHPTPPPTPTPASRLRTERCEKLTLDLTWPTDPRTLSREVTCGRPAPGPANHLSSTGEGALQVPPITEELLAVGSCGRRIIFECVSPGRFPMVHWVVPHACPRGQH